jgi:hypothetical protein
MINRAVTMELRQLTAALKVIEKFRNDDRAMSLPTATAMVSFNQQSGT